MVGRIRAPGDGFDHLGLLEFCSKKILVTMECQPHQASRGKEFDKDYLEVCKCAVILSSMLFD